AVPPARRRHLADRAPRHSGRAHSARLRRVPAVIVVGGEALVDLIEDGEHRLRPVPGGGPFSAAIAVGRLGVPVAFFGTLSSDGYGSLLGDLLADAGVDTSLVRRSDAPTPLAIVHRGNGSGTTYPFYLTDPSLTDLPQDALPELPRA